MKLNRVAAGIDDNYLIPFLVMLFSAWKTSSQSFEVVVGFDGLTLSQRSREQIRQFSDTLGISVEFIEVSFPAETLAAGHISLASYTRLVLADMLDETFVWLDSDIICEVGWEELLSMKSDSGVIVSAAYDPAGNIDWQKSENFAVRDARGRYFNTGVMVVDGKGWTRLGFPTKWKNLIPKYLEYNFQWADQCVINYLAMRNFSPLHQKFNYQEQDRDPQLAGPAFIRHFNGPTKPWNYKHAGFLLWLGPFSDTSVQKYLEVQSECQFFIRKNLEEHKDLAGMFNAENRYLSVGTHLHLAISRLLALSLRFAIFRFSQSIFRRLFPGGINSFRRNS
jgi:lipopolysaccharide biosynthesis glycosyltransferase